MSTIRTRKKTRAATDQPQHCQAKQRKQLSTEIRPLRSNAALRARLKSEEEAAARPLVNANQERSPFLKLPGEIRICIYKFALGGNVITPAFIRKTDVTPARVTRYRTNAIAMSTFKGMILSCRAIKAETELLLYSENVFSDVSMCADEWSHWTQLLDENKRAAVKMLKTSFRREYYQSFQPVQRLRNFDIFPSLKVIIVRQRPCDPYDAAAKMETYAQTRKLQLVFEETRCRWHH